MAKLMNTNNRSVSKNRIKFTNKLAEKTKAVVVLKGSGTIVANANDMFVSNKAVPALATAGTGDILSGLIGGLLAQGIEPINAACSSVYLHTQAGILVQEEIGAISSKASDLFHFLPKLINEISNKNHNKNI